MAILVIGLAITAMALINEIYDGNVKRLTFEKWWPPSLWNGISKGVAFWTLIHYLLILSPIVVTILITAAGRFKQGNKWLLLRAAAEAIKREIYRFRAKAEAYSGLPPAVATGATATTPALPQATPEQVLAQRVEDITRRAMRTEVNSSCLVPYDKNKGFPPDMYAAEGGDDGFSMLTPDQYIQVRLGDQLRLLQEKNSQARMAIEMGSVVDLHCWRVGDFPRRNQPAGVGRADYCSCGNTHHVPGL